MFFIGIDVSKAKLDCSLLLDVASAKRRDKSVANSKAGVGDLLAWCAKQQVTPDTLHAILEGTGVYHEQAALALSDAGVTVSIVNPAQVKDFGRSLGVRTKTDGVDSLVLARYGALLNPRPWTPPAREARILQALRRAAKRLPRIYSASEIVWKNPMRPTLHREFVSPSSNPLSFWPSNSPKSSKTSMTISISTQT